MNTTFPARSNIVLILQPLHVFWHHWFLILEDMKWWSQRSKCRTTIFLIIARLHSKLINSCEWKCICEILDWFAFFKFSRYLQPHYKLTNDILQVSPIFRFKKSCLFQTHFRKIVKSCIEYGCRSNGIMFKDGLPHLVAKCLQHVTVEGSISGNCSIGFILEKIRPNDRLCHYTIPNTTFEY